MKVDWKSKAIEYAMKRNEYASRIVELENDNHRLKKTIKDLEEGKEVFKIESFKDFKERRK